MFATLAVSLAHLVSFAQQVQQVGPIVMTVADLQRSVLFYSRILTFEKVNDVVRIGAAVDQLYGIPGARLHVVEMRLGEETIDLQQFEGVDERLVPRDARSNDLSFQHIAIIVSDMDSAYRILRQNHVEHVSAFPQTLPSWNANASGIRAFYFKDLDGHPLEILQFPPGKGDAKWHVLSGRTFLGIDHTAIVVADTDASLTYYRDVLGMRVTGESDNYGSEQEHLNNVFGAHLRITSLRSPAGPGIELLEYISPHDGHPAFSDASPTDIVHHETVIAVRDLDALNTSKSKRYTPISELGEQSELLLQARRGKLITDPDGHALLAVQR
jgi:catechol 2,3-dioxygenase-like lactoylglutathione lyase family enzyme